MEMQNRPNLDLHSVHKTLSLQSDLGNQPLRPLNRVETDLKERIKGTRTRSSIG